jgi:hypothetical protein
MNSLARAICRHSDLLKTDRRINHIALRYGVAASRLQVEGYGRTELLDKANPTSAINRRVQVSNLGKANQ